MSNKYGEAGKEYEIGGQTVKVDEEFILATILAIVAVITHNIPRFDEQTSAVAAKIYEEIKKTN